MDKSTPHTQPHKRYMGEAMKHPEALYTEPQQVMDDKALTYQEKLKVLENWADEVKHVLESRAENMNPEKSAAKEDELLQKIQTMIAGLKDQNAE